MNRAVAVLVRKELAELRRDRRVLLLSLVLPVLLYPLAIGGMDRMEASRERERRVDRLEIAIDGPRLPLLEKVLADSTLVVRWATADSFDAWLSRSEIALGLELPARLPALGDDTPETVRISVRNTRESSREATRRIREHLDAALGAERQARWAAAGGADTLDAVVVTRGTSIASASEEGGARASRLLVYLLLMTVFMGGSAFATDMVAGEKERQTLETLFLAPVPRAAIARAKLVVVAAGTAFTGLLSLASLAVSYAAGWIGAEGGGTLVLAGRTLVTIGALLVPLAMLLGSVLLAVSTWARSLKEAQYYVLPIMLVVFVPALMSMTQAIELGPFVAILPIANVAFVMRDVLSGQLSLPLLGLVLASTLGWTLLVAREVVQLLSREETVLGFDPEPLLAPTEGGRRRAAHLGMASTVLAYFYAGQWLQSEHLGWGLAASLWLLLPILALGTVGLVRPVGGRWRRRFALSPAPPSALLGAVCLGWGAMLPMANGVQRLQSWLLPMSSTQAEGMGAALEGLGIGPLLLLAALSPAIAEELVFRGVFLGLLLEQGSRRRAVVLSSVWFALVHLSVYRFLPTFLLGLLLGGLRLRHRSLVPAVALHLAYNGTLLALGWAYRDRPAPVEADGPWAWALSLTLLAAGTVLSGGLSTLRRRPAALS